MMMTMTKDDSSDECNNSIIVLPCTCGRPETVRLGNDDTRASSREAAKSSLLLLHNLQHFGWCPLQVSADQVVKTPPPTPEEILQVFRQTNQKTEDDDILYIAAESGSSQGTSVEPKESLQVELSKCGDDDDSNNSNKIKVWCRALSKIAHHVCEQLRLPPGTFLSPKDDDQSLDLLRVFHYYAVPSNQDEAQEDSRMGSSPHTDWGSLTIVWQDHVGGLQTYCRNCQKWIPVDPPPPTNKEETVSPLSSHWNVIVHVGDMASLALGEVADRNASTITTTTASSTAPTTTSCYYWPSPKHRVVSSPTQDRVSLVYFAYPPPEKTLQELRSLLQDWQSHHGGTASSSSSSPSSCLPLEEYYLLQDQSSSSSCIQNYNNNKNQKSPKKERIMYQTILNLPMREIVQLKWKQVNRDKETTTTERG
jgi:2OG-Fe(II) oxygenase superfamily